ncbi:MAG: hypothetical protein HY698_10145 [Deltaproteobacteria bacterium]|nr:hypothetical protein [Deltaproteobacteria bacterium]
MAGLSKRLWAFSSRVHAPGLHIAYAAFWFLALDGALVVSSGKAHWHLGLDSALAILSLFLLLFFLRVLDEIKDIDYDRLHNPDRPLVSGLVSQRDLVLFLVGTAGVVALLHLGLSRRLFTIAVVDMVYGVALMFLERLSPRVRNGMGWNLLVTYPVNILLSVYTYVFFAERHGAEPETGMLLVGALALAFLHYEIGRKTRWPGHGPAGERLYSQFLGPRGAAALATTCAALATAIVLFVMAPWQKEGAVAAFAWWQIAPLVPAVAGAVLFLLARNGPHAGRKVMKPLALAYLFLFYASLIGLACIARPPWN